MNPPVPDDASAADPAAIRRTYGAGELSEATLAPTWTAQLRRWYAEAVDSGLLGEPNALQVATVDAEGRPDVRTVLARGIDEEGVVFFTNYSSAKGAQLAARPYAAGLFSWLPLERQVRFRGPVSRVTREETAAYFASRPRESQLSAWASPQSHVIDGRGELERRVAETAARFTDREIEAPPFWGGFRITIEEIEFWQGREFRLHDRLRFRSAGGEGWVVERLGP